MAEIGRLYHAGLLSEQAFRTWSRIDAGQVWEGTMDIIWQEQTFLQPVVFAQRPAVWDTVSMRVKSPVPGDQGRFLAVVPGGNIGNLSDRMRWIEKSMFPMSAGTWSSSSQRPGADPVVP